MSTTFSARSYPVDDHMLELFGSVFLAAANDDLEIEDFPGPDATSGTNKWSLRDIVNWMEYQLEASEVPTLASGADTGGTMPS